ncbi:bigA [Symbiodinium sp. CCMP2592]|nr:bigA [Symbiodinium sp. CCMP2592]
MAEPDAVVPVIVTLKKKNSKRAVPEIQGLWEAWEEDPVVRKGARKRKSLLFWPNPSKTGLINKASLKCNWRVVLAVVRLYCPRVPSDAPTKTVPVAALKDQVAKFFDDISITPRRGLVHCEAHSLKMFLSYMNRRNDGSRKKDATLAALYQELEKHWAPKVRSRRTLASGDEEDDDDEQEEQEEQEEEEGEDETTLTEPEDDDDRFQLVDPYLAEAMGLEAGSPPPPSAYVGTVAYEPSEEAGIPIPYEAKSLTMCSAANDVDLVRQLAEIEQRIAHRRAALSGQQAAQKWGGSEHIDSQKTSLWDLFGEDAMPPPEPDATPNEPDTTTLARQDGASDLSLFENDLAAGATKQSTVAPNPVATPARAKIASQAPAVEAQAEASQALTMEDVEDPAITPKPLPDALEVSSVKDGEADSPELLACEDKKISVGFLTYDEIPEYREKAKQCEAEDEDDDDDDVPIKKKPAMAKGKPGRPKGSGNKSTKTDKDTAKKTGKKNQEKENDEAKTLPKKKGKKKDPESEDENDEDKTPPPQKKGKKKDPEDKENDEDKTPPQKKGKKKDPEPKKENDEDKTPPKKNGNKKKDPEPEDENDEDKTPPKKKGKKKDPEDKENDEDTAPPKKKDKKKDRDDKENDEDTAPPKKKDKKKDRQDKENDEDTAPPKKDKKKDRQDKENDEDKTPPKKNGNKKKDHEDKENDEDTAATKKSKKKKVDDEDTTPPKKKSKKPDAEEKENDEDTAATQKKGTFASRNPGKGARTVAIWTAIRDAFDCVLRDKFRYTTKMEGLFWADCRPVLLEVKDDTELFQAAKKFAAKWLKMDKVQGAPMVQATFAKSTLHPARMQALGIAGKQEKPLRATSWHSSQTGSQQDLMPESQSELEVPATQKEADTQLPASPVPALSESLGKGTPQSERSEPTPGEGTNSNPAPSQPTPEKKNTSSEPGASQPEAVEQAALGSQSKSEAPAVETSQPEKPDTSEAPAVAKTSQPEKPDTSKAPPVAKTSQPEKPDTSKAPPVAKTSQPEKPGTNTRPTNKDTKDPKATKNEPEEDEYVAPVEDHPPPPPISKATLMKRLARICAPKADGTYKVPLEIIQTHKNLESRDDVYRAFEKCGGDPASPSRLQTVIFTKKVNQRYEEINEKSVETEFEFLTEAEMEEKGWSEKSEYCDEWMYWVAVRVRGSNKKTKRHTVTELLEGADQEPMQDPDEAMENFPFELEGDGDKKQGEGDDEEESDSSDDGEEAARILKRIAYPEIPKKPQDASMLVTGCLQKRANKLQLLLAKMESDASISLTTTQLKILI